jgi:hypothetical protein
MASADAGNIFVAEECKMNRFALSLVCVGALLFSQQGSAGDSAADFYVVRDRNEITEIAGKFERELHKLGVQGTIVSCTNAVNVAVGVRGGNIAHGAICTWSVAGKTVNALLCNDDMVGNFALSVSYVRANDSVAAFAKDNCLKS